MVGEHLDLVSGGDDLGTGPRGVSRSSIPGDPGNRLASQSTGSPLSGVDSDGSDRTPALDKDAGRSKQSGEPFLGMQFNCCRIYTRIYRNREKTAYEGRCPKCARKVLVPIGSGGSGSRFFEVS